LLGKNSSVGQNTGTPLIRLGHRFRSPHKTADSSATPIMNAPTVLMLALGNERVAIQVDRCWGEQRFAIRQVEGDASGSSRGGARHAGFTGCTILGDGRVVPLVNASELLHWIASCKQSHSSNKIINPPTTVRARKTPSWW